MRHASKCTEGEWVVVAEVRSSDAVMPPTRKADVAAEGDYVQRYSGSSLRKRRPVGQPLVLLRAAG